MAAPAPASIFGAPVKKESPGGPSQKSEFNAIFSRYKIPSDWRSIVLQAATDYRMDPAVLAAFVAFEGGWGPKSLEKHDGQVLGPAQINDTQAAPTNAAGVPFFRSDLQISDQDKLDPTFALKYMAWRVSGLLQTGRSIHDAYAGSGGYNPGFTGDSRGSGPEVFLTSTGKDYVPTVHPSPVATAATEVATKTARQGYTDPYVTADGKPVPGDTPPPDALPSQRFYRQAMRQSEYQQLLGRSRTDPWITTSGQEVAGLTPPADVRPSQLVLGESMRRSEYKQLLGRVRTDPYVTSTGETSKSIEPPANAIASTQFSGQAMRLSEFHTLGRSYNEIYSAFTGRRATNSELAQLAQSPISTFELKQRLANGSGFDKSPVWQAHAGSYVSEARRVMGEGYTPTKKLIAQALGQGQDPTSFGESLRQLPEFEKSPIFQDARAKLANQFQQIYGTPGPNAKDIIQAHAKAGWSPDEFASWLRGQPAYTTSTEYQTRQLDIATQLGLITGHVPDLVRGPQPPNPNADYPTTLNPPASGGTPPYPYTGPGPDSQPQPRNPYVLGTVNA